MTRWLIGFTVILMVVATILLGRSARAPDPVTTRSPPTADPGYSARDATVIETGNDGRPQYRLHADLIEQAPDDLTITLTHPILHYADARGGTWRASALTGFVPADRELVQLAGNVELTGTLASGGAPALVTTSRLAFDTQREVASTDAPVTIDWSGHRLAAVGLHADLKAETLRLESAVHGRFVPQ